jgi:hypothetical protein
MSWLRRLFGASERQGGSSSAGGDDDKHPVPINIAFGLNHNFTEGQDEEARRAVVAALDEFKREFPDLIATGDDPTINVKVRANTIFIGFPTYLSPPDTAPQLRERMLRECMAIFARHGFY